MQAILDETAPWLGGRAIIESLIGFRGLGFRVPGRERDNNVFVAPAPTTSDHTVVIKRVLLSGEGGGSRLP